MDNILLIALLMVVALAAVVVAAMSKTKNSALQQELANLKQEQAVKSQELTQLQQANVSLTSHNATLSANQAYFEERLKERDHTIAAQQEQIKEHAAQLAAKEAQVRTQCQEQNQQTLAEIKAAHHEAATKLEHTITDQNNELVQLRGKIQALTNELASAHSQKEAVEHMRAEDQTRQQQAAQELEHRLNTLGEKLLKERSQALQQLNSEQMGTIIKPLESELKTFRNLLTQTQQTNSEQAGRLRTELEHLQQAQQTLGLQADKLAAALLQGHKSQGMWGEQQLELVLESSGLSLDQNYLREVAATNDHGQRGRADVIVKLPGGRGIVIDAKCSLTAYTEYINLEQLAQSVGLDANAVLFGSATPAAAAPAEESATAPGAAPTANTSTTTSARSSAPASAELAQLKGEITSLTGHDLRARLRDALKRHVTSLENHVAELIERDYPSFEQYGSPSLVFMFVPIDHALGLALRAKPEIYANAQEKGIYLVSPSSLLPALRLVGNLWVLGEQSEKFKKLSQLAERIALKSEKVCRDFEAVSKAVTSLNSATSNLSTSLYDGRGNLRTLLGNFASKAPALTAKALTQIEQDFAHEQALEHKQEREQELLVHKEQAAALLAPDGPESAPEPELAKPSRKRTPKATKKAADPTPADAPTEDSSAAELTQAGVESEVEAKAEQAQSALAERSEPA
ncbi:MAG TPA: DNA recombination protein RmuC [Candidatus Anaerobiospirillum stercoravium]|nr:DNA recombination protein RmuC [Candidatus Anaerobiospirillum stercoravium]